MTVPLVIVTGMSGAGRSAALKSLEDLGFEAVDNLPMTFVRSLLVDDGHLDSPLAIGIDSRTRGFVPDALVGRIAGWRSRPGQMVTLLFMECEDEVLRRRFTETRRRHPMAVDRPVMAGIADERAFLAPLKAAADLVFDSTATSTADLKRWIGGRFGDAAPGELVLTVMSFAFRHGLPREADLVLDLRFLSNPHYVPDLRALTGQHAAVRDHVLADPAAREFLAGLEAVLLPLLPRYAAEGKTYLTLAVGCTGGQHRSVVVAEQLDARLRANGWPTVLVHRDMPRDRRSPQA